MKKSFIIASVCTGFCDGDKFLWTSCEREGIEHDVHVLRVWCGGALKGKLDPSDGTDCTRVTRIIIGYGNCRVRRREAKRAPEPFGRLSYQGGAIG